MTPTVEPLGPAAVMWNDFVGSAAADDVNGSAGDREVYELAGLDPQRWMILAVDLVLHGGSEHARVYALDRVETGVHSHDELLEHAERQGELVVDAFEIAPPSAGTHLIRSIFDRVSVRLIARGVSDQRLLVRAGHD